MSKTSLFEFSSIDELEKQIFDKYNSDEEFKKEREKVYYKAFKFGELFDRISNSIGISMKDLFIKEKPEHPNDILLINESRFNNGINGYIDYSSEFKDKILSDNITISDSYTRGFYQKGEYTTTTSHLNSLVAKEKLNWNNLGDKGKELLALYITLIFDNKFHGYNRKICTGNEFNREIILLPCYEIGLNKNVKITEFQEDPIKKSKNNKILKKEKEKNIRVLSSTGNSVEIATDHMGYLYTLIRVDQFNKKAKQLQDEIINL